MRIEFADGRICEGDEMKKKNRKAVMEYRYFPLTNTWKWVKVRKK